MKDESIYDEIIVKLHHFFFFFYHFVVYNEENASILSYSKNICSLEFLIFFFSHIICQNICTYSLTFIVDIRMDLFGLIWESPTTFGGFFSSSYYTIVMYVQLDSNLICWGLSNKISVRKAFVGFPLLDQSSRQRTYPLID